MLFLALAPAVSLGGAERSGTQDDWNRFTTPVFHELTTRNGLPHETISALAKDSSGILWIGTFGGVARWDGHRLRQFGNQSDDSTGIGDRYIRAILPLPGGGMLLGTNSGGLVRYDADRETFRTYRVGPGGTSHSKIFALAAARDGGVWIATDGGLDRWDPHRESISPVSLTLENGESATARLFTVLEDTQGNLWVGGNLGLAVRRAGRNTFERATSKDEPVKRILAGECWSLREDDKGRIWFGTGASGVAYATPDGVVTCPAALAEVPGMGLWRTVRSILQISPQRIWFGTDGAGIISYDPDSGQVERLAHDPAVPGTLNGDSIRAMLGDPHGNVWVGTHRGLERHDLSQRTVRSVFASPNNPRALSDSNVYSILSDPQGRVWAGLASGRLDILDLRSGNVTRLRLPAPHADRDVQALALGRDGSLLVGSLGVCRVDPITLTVTPSAIPCVDNKIVLFIGQDGADYLIGTYSGLYRYTPATGAWSASQANPKLPDALADDHVRVALRLPDGRLLVGGAFTSLQPVGAALRVTRRNFARLLSSGQVDTGFDASAGGASGAVVSALAVQPDGRVVAVGSFADLGGAKSTNIARFRSEGTPDPDFSPVLATDGPVHAIVVRTAGAPVPTQLSGFAWLNANGTLRAAFASAGARLSGEIAAVAIDREGRLLVGGSFANLGNAAGGNLARFRADGALDASFTPAPNGAVTGIIVQPDGRIVVTGSFTTVGGTARNRMARIDNNGSLDVTFDPGANARIAGIVRQTDGKFVVGGDFTSFTPNLTSTSVARNYLARVNEDGTIDANYNPSPSASVNGLALQADGKVVAVGSFNSLVPNATSTAVTRNYVARLNSDGSLDQNFNPNASGPVNAVVALTNGQFLLGGSFTSLQPAAGGALVLRNNLARINSDGAVDQSFNPNPNGTVTTLAVQSDGFVLLGGAFTTLQPGGTGAPVGRNRLARVDTGGAIDLNFNPDIRGNIGVVAARPDGTVLVGGSFTDLQLNGSILVGGSFAGDRKSTRLNSSHRL